MYSMCFVGKGWVGSYIFDCIIILNAGYILNCIAYLILHVLI